MRRLSGNAQKPAITPTQYRERLFQTLSGWKNELPTGADVVIAVFDAATSGRLALTYYNELQASDFLDRLCHWDNTCCWENGKFGIQPPSLFQIVNCAYGSPRDGKPAAEDKILRQQMQRLLSCRVDKAPFPLDIERRIVQKASNLLRYDPNTQRKLLFTACAVIQKYHYDHDQDKERWNMETDLSTKDRSFQFGRLLAVMEYAEQSYYRKTSGGKPGEDDRETNAIRMMPVFCQRPWSTYEVINKKLRTAYLPRISGWQRAFYAKQTDEIVGILNETDQTKRNHPLADTYLLGYHLQRKAMWQKKNTENNTEEEN